MSSKPDVHPEQIHSTRIIHTENFRSHMKRYLVGVGFCLAASFSSTLWSAEVCAGRSCPAPAGGMVVCTDMRANGSGYSVMSIGVMSTLGGANCGYNLVSPSGAFTFTASVTIPANPTAGCVFTFRLSAFGQNTCTLDVADDSLPVELMEFSVEEDTKG